MRILAFDPSLLNLGVSVGEVIDGRLQVEYAETFYLDKLVDHFSPMSDWDVDPNSRRVEMLERVSERILLNYKPDIIVIELPIFNGKNPKSLQVQMKAIVTLEMLALKHVGALRSNVVQYMPNVIKQGVGINVREARGDKEAVTKALLKLMDDGSLTYASKMYEPNSVDEHANDSCAMLYTKFLDLQEIYNVTI